MIPPTLVSFDLDLSLPVELLSWVAHRMEAEGVPAVVHLPSVDGWVTWSLPPPEIGALANGAAEAWITQRSGCSGLVTRLVLLDEHGSALACIDTPRAPGAAEPVAWRVILLTALLAARMDGTDVV